MPIEQSELAQVRWDDDGADGQASAPIDLAQVAWDDAPAAAASNPANSSAFARMVSGQAAPADDQIFQDLQRSNVEGMTLGEKLGAGAGKAVVDSGRGLEQALVGGWTGQAALFSQLARRAGLTDVADVFDRNIGASLLDRSQDVQERIDEAKRMDQGLMSTGAGVTGNALGHMAMLALPAGEVGAAARGLGLAGRTAVSAGTGAATGAIQPVASGENRLTNIGVGAALGPAGEVLGGAAGALGRRAAAAIDPVRQRAIQFARDQNIPLHVSQISESLPVKAMASMAQYLPFSGAGRAASNQQRAFNQAVARTFGANADQLTDDVMRSSRRGLSQRFEDIYNRNDVPLSQTDIGALASLNNAASRRLTRDEAEVVANQFDDILAELNQAGALTGQKYQALRTQIMKAEGPDKVGQAVASLRKELDNIAARAVGPDDSAALRELRSQWANLRTVEGVLKQVAGAGGDVRPSALWPAIRNGSTQEMRELARLGQTVMKNPVPDSGTAGRTIAANLLGLGGATAGGLPGLVGLLAGGATVGRALNSNTLARLASSTNPGSGLNLLARLAPPAALAATPAAVAAGNRRDPVKKPSP